MMEWRGLYLPDGEVHLPEWMADKNVVVDGKPTYQFSKLQAALKHCRQFRCAVDVGAHIGLWSMHLVKHFDHLHAFEPVAAHRECFALNVTTDNVTIHPVALGASEQRVNIWSNPTSSGDSWVDGPGDIPMHTLDSFALKHVDLLKVDCEGFEGEVLRGAVETLRRCHPTVVVEQKPNMAEKFGLQHKGAVRFLQGLGYAVRQKISGDYILT